MANVTLRGTSNLINVLPKRFASAAAAHEHAKPKASFIPKEAIKVSKLESGLVVASLENYSAVTRIAAVVNAGTRDEQSSQLGAVHALRAYSNLATKNYSKYGVTRTLDQLGAEFSVTSSREQTTYLLQSTRKNAAKGVDILADIISRPELRHWEIDDSRPRLEFDLDVYEERPELQLVELIHRASFNGGLGNSLYAPRFNVHNLNSDLLQEFRRRNFTSNRLALIGVGVKHDELVRFAEHFRLPAAAADGSRHKSSFLPIELRQDNTSDLVHVALGAEGVSLSGKDFLAAALASQALGTAGQRIKYSSSNKLSRAILPLASQPASVSTFNASYSDAGLFGFHIAGDKADIGKLARGLVKELQNVGKNGLSANELTAARNNLKHALAESIENSQGLIERIALNPELANTQTSESELFKQVDAVSANDVNAFLKRVATGKLSLAAIGDLSELPRLAELH